MNIVFCDIDGTFEDHSGRGHHLNYEAIYALQRQGDHFVFVTGRGYGQLADLLASIDSECDVIFSNGAGYKRIGEPVVYNHCLSLAVCEATIKVLEERNIFYHIHTNNGIILKPLTEYRKNLVALREKLSSLGEAGKQIMDMKETFFSEQCQHVDDPLAYLYSHPDQKVLKIELMEASDAERQILRQQLSSDQAYVFSSYTQCLEVVHPLSSKGNAIQEFMRMYPEAKSYGIGDGENDLAMLAVVDVPVAVANAVPEVKEMAQYLTTACAEGGVGEFIFAHVIQENSLS